MLTSAREQQAIAYQVFIHAAPLCATPSSTPSESASKNSRCGWKSYPKQRATSRAAD